MNNKKAKFESVCPACGEKVLVVASPGDILEGKVAVKERCQRCLNSFEAISDLDCLEWDDQCNLEIGRLG